jgi:hypothetical protein
MLLADNSVIKALVATPDRRQRPCEGLPKPKAKVETRSGARCRCGRCRTCVDDARWERVFNEKFADPEYYRPRLAAMGSSLNLWGR